jgi:hypothetical protein
LVLSVKVFLWICGQKLKLTFYIIPILAILRLRGDPEVMPQVTMQMMADITTFKAHDAEPWKIGSDDLESVRSVFCSGSSGQSTAADWPEYHHSTNVPKKFVPSSRKSQGVHQTNHGRMCGSHAGLDSATQLRTQVAWLDQRKGLFPAPPGLEHEVATKRYSKASVFDTRHPLRSAPSPKTVILCMDEKSAIDWAPKGKDDVATLRFSNPGQFIHWLFSQPRGDIIPWATLVAGFREAKPCAVAIHAALSGNVRKMRPDHRRPELPAPVPEGTSVMRVAVDTMVITLPHERAAKTVSKWACSDFMEDLEILAVTDVIHLSQTLKSLRNSIKL